MNCYFSILFYIRLILKEEKIKNKHKSLSSEKYLIVFCCYCGGTFNLFYFILSPIDINKNRD
jgi:hypothetical protein